MRRLRLTGISVVATIALGAAGFAVVPSDWYSHAAYDKKYGLGPYEGQLDPRVRAALAKDVPTLEQFVAKARGGPFRDPVSVEFLPDKQFLDALGNDDKTPDNAVELGFATDQTDAQDEVEQELDAVTGFYDSYTKSLYVRGKTLDAEGRTTIVHELTHAWDDQHFTLDQYDDAESDDGAQAALALQEGDATSVEDAYRDTLPMEQRCAVIADSLEPYDAACKRAGYYSGLKSDAVATTPIEAEDDFPYVVGVRFVGYLVAHGGQRAVDRAFRDPPVDTAQVIEPETYLHNVKPVAVPPPRVTGAVGTHDLSLGAMQLSALVSDGALGPGTTGYVFGWRGDAARTFSQAGARCLTANVRFADVTTTNRFLDRLSEWRGRQRGRRFARTSSTLISLHQCAAAA